MKEQDQQKGRPGISRRMFGAGIAAGIGAAAILSRLKKLMKPRTRASFHEAEFYERIGADMNHSKKG
jgi:hypothetical protein